MILSINKLNKKSKSAFNFGSNFGFKFKIFTVHCNHLFFFQFWFQFWVQM